ncbi:glycosyltransferase family 2 protein [Novosphingobium sp.]|uniref:glycosyltransferase family 2 protein n=1 Tax=Novosphingobium sp. TaxID=1874826 RepID=UPI003B52367F
MTKPAPTAMPLPRVAVLLATYNGADYLPEQLESLRTQRDVAITLHARDDGSTDTTCAILRQTAAIWPELKGAQPQPNLGAAYSFLQLLQTAPDDAGYYAFCDQDDVWLPDKLARAAAALSTDEGPALYCSNLTCVARDLTVIGVPAAHRDERFLHILFENIATGCTIVLNAKARALINSKTPLTGLVMHDWWCALVVAALGRIHYDPEPTLLYRQHGANSVGQDPTWLSQSARNLKRFLRQPRSCYPIHAQAAELLRLFGSRMPAPARADLEALVASKRGWHARVAYALSGKVVRRRVLNAVFVRALILAGWY